MNADRHNPPDRPQVSFSPVLCAEDQNGTFNPAGKQLHECLNLTGNVNARNRCIPQCTDHEIVRKTDRKGDQILKGDRNRQLDQ